MMGEMHGDDETSSSKNALSFKIKAKSTKKFATSTPQDFSRKEIEENDNDGDIEYITTADGAEFKSSEKKRVPSKLVIPMIAKNQWINNEITEGGDSLTNQALDEILNGLSSENEGNKDDETAAIPLMMKNRLPPAKDGVVMDEKYDISLRPEESTMEDYESIPISSFGSAMLRGMGWSEKQAIGGVNKAAVAPIEYIPRHKGLGLGAEKVQEKNKSKKRKIGERENDDKKFRPIVDSDGRVRHTKRVGEEVPEQTNEFVPGKYVIILKKPHKDLYGRIISVDEDGTRISVKLLISGELIQVSQFNASIVDKSEINSEKVCQSSLKSGKSQVSKGEKTSKKKDYDNEPSSSMKSHWLHPNIRVRIIGKSFENGKYYNKKAKILDVTSSESCTCRTEENKILDDVHEKYLETIIPKSKGSYVMVVGGKYKGKHAKLLERKKSECLATVQLISNKHVTTLSFDNISEFTGELPDDEFL